jgi:hypothetical protein
VTEGTSYTDVSVKTETRDNGSSKEMPREMNVPKNYSTPFEMSDEDPEPPILMGRDRNNYDG